MTEHWIGGQRSGKSLAAAQNIVKWCAGTGQGVAVFSEAEKDRIMAEAARQGVDIPEPVVINLKNDKSLAGFTAAGAFVDKQI